MTGVETDVLPLEIQAEWLDYESLRLGIIREALEPVNALIRTERFVDDATG